MQLCIYHYSMSVIVRYLSWLYMYIYICSCSFIECICRFVHNARLDSIHFYLLIYRPLFMCFQFKATLASSIMFLEKVCQDQPKTSMPSPASFVMKHSQNGPRTQLFSTVSLPPEELVCQVCACIINFFIFAWMRVSAAGAVLSYRWELLDAFLLA